MKTVNPSYNGRYTVIAILGALFIGKCSVAAARDYPKSRDGVVQISAGNTLFNAPSPSRALSKALKQDKTSAQFWVNWTYGAGGGGGIYTALYNRKKSTLKLYSKYDDEYGVTIKQSLFSKVTDDALIQLAEKYKTGMREDGTTDDDDMGYFGRITSFGAQEEILRGVKTGFHPYKTKQ